MPSNVSSRSNTPSPLIVDATTTTTIIPNSNLITKDINSLNNASSSSNANNNINNINNNTNSGNGNNNGGAKEMGKRSSEETSFIAQGNKLGVEIV